MDLHLRILIAIPTILTLLSIFLNFLRKCQSDVVPINWPVVGMLPHLLANVHRFHNYVTHVLRLTGCTFVFKGPWLSSMTVLATADPANVHHIMSKNFANFPKGDEFSQIFDILGDGIFNVDFEPWKYHRRITHSFLAHPSFHRFLTETVANKVKTGLVPLMEDAYENGRVMDLEDLFQRFTFDTICTLVTGTDPECLSLDLPEAPFCKALDEAEEVLFLRHVVPKSIWKLQRWLGIGSERKLKKARRVLDEFVYKALEVKRREMKKEPKRSSLDDHRGLDLLTLYIEHSSEVSVGEERDLRFSDKFLRDMFLNLLIAGRDTTSAALTWFFWLLHKHPRVESKIREELNSVVGKEGIGRLEEIDKLVYLHGALCETLRLYPPVPLEHKSPIEADVLPSGHELRPKTMIIISLYAMGRQESVWGKDCLEFKPERWITERGKVKHEPSYKFLAFNAGPRTCLGKGMGFMQMKAVAASVLLNGYHLKVIDEDSVEPNISIILHTKHGLKVRVLKEPCKGQ